MDRGIEAWSAYWRSGRSASCFHGRDTELRLNQIWDDLVDRLPQTCRLLDLATGNGTVARTCAARARLRGIDIQIDAVDAAQIDPQKQVADPESLFRHVRFHSSVMLENLPFPDQTFDGVVSQFGFEYADEAQASREAARVTAPGGLLRLVIHACDGAVSRDIRLRVQRLRSVLSDGGPLTLVRTLARAAADGDKRRVRRLSAELPRAAALARQLAVSPPPDDAALFYAGECLTLWSRRHRYWPADLCRSLDDGWANAAGVLRRQEQMLAAARSDDDISALCERLRDAKLEVGEKSEIRDELRGVRIAWLIEARKPADQPVAE